MRAADDAQGPADLRATREPEGAVRILIAEDSPTQAERLKFILERHGYEVTAAENGATSLALLAENKPDLVLSDIVMPEMDGYELCRRIRADAGLADLPVVLLTSLAEAADVLEGLACGADSFITKPYSEDYLLAQVTRVLADHQRTGGAGPSVDVEVVWAGEKRTIVTDQKRLVTLLISTYEAAVRRNSELARTQDELRLLNERLEDMVAERTAALTAEIAVRSQAQDQLRQAQKVEAIGSLAGGIAHDFNNLTSIVLGYGELLLGQLSPVDPARKSVEQILAAGRRSAALTRQILAFSRRQTLQPEVLDLNALLQNLEKMLGRLLGANIELEFRLAADAGRLTADPGQLEQVVTNLAINARDAMPLGGRLTVETAAADLDEGFARDHEGVVPGTYVLLALTDTGCGMDKVTMARLFEPFFTTKEKGKGTGLGLATASGIVKQSGGHIYAFSEPGTGTTFRIYLPRTDAPPAAKVPGAGEAGGVTPWGSGERILLVDDEAPLRELCETMLSGLGYRVSAARSGQEALALVAEKGLEPDLVVTDVIMPGMSGAEMAQRLRRDRLDLKVLYMSGYPDDVIAPHGVLSPGTNFIPKPFSERAFAVKVREALGGMTAVARPGRRVLMIDDDEQFRDLMEIFCTKGGHVFAGTDSAAASLAALAAQSFDVLLVDVNIPGTSGELVLREIRAAGCVAPAIMLTADVGAADMEALRPLGVVSALQKSSNAALLLQAIEKAGTSDGNQSSPARPGVCDESQ